nr:MAG TPA: hypothetical protein [Caudoviricetes sp.]
MGVWELVYQLLYQKKSKNSTLFHESNMRSQKIICLYIFLVHLEMKL